MTFYPENRNTQVYSSKYVEDFQAFFVKSKYPHSVAHFNETHRRSVGSDCLGLTCALTSLDGNACQHSLKSSAGLIVWSLSQRHTAPSPHTYAQTKVFSSIAFVYTTAFSKRRPWAANKSIRMFCRRAASADDRRLYKSGFLLTKVNIV